MKASEATMRVTVLIIGLLVLALGTTALVAAELPGSRVSEEFIQSFTMAPGQKLTVQGNNARITYEQWDGDQVVIKATSERIGLLADLADRISGGVTIEFSQDDHGVRAVTQYPKRLSFLRRVSVRFLVRVPRDWHGDITLTTSNGPITVSGMRGDATLRTSNGTISVEGHTGALQARTSNGPILLSDVNGAVQARTSNGPIRLKGGTLTNNGYLRTSNGAIELRAELETDASYEVITSNGGVTLVLADPDVALDMSTSNGRIDLRTDVTVSSVDRRRVVGRIGDGVANLNVKTSNGSISLSAVHQRD